MYCTFSPLAATADHNHLRPRPAPLPRRLGAPPSSNRHLSRSSVALHHPSNVPPNVASTPTTVTLKASENAAPSTLSSRAQLLPCSRVAVVLSVAAPTQLQRFGDADSLVNIAVKEGKNEESVLTGRGPECSSY
jgi:hypothetical protein